MPEAATSAAPPQNPPPAPAPVKKKEYTLRFEPIGDFNETELFVKGVVRGKIWIGEKIVARFKSLTGEEVDKINEAIKVTNGMTSAQYNTDVTYHNLAHALEAINEQGMPADFGERLKKVRAMASAILGRLSLAYLEFNDHIDELFVGKEVGELTKKS